MNIDTKKIINSARDVLVGKVPDPKAQVEQITFAMFYKFMDEMDKAAVELGGKRQFFVGEFEKFSWTKLMDPRLGGIDRMDLYTQALVKMSQNPHIAQLFRDIYKDAFIPFRSPETLNLFLKEIDQLDYSNTESLGDAFEYLLSVMGSQGDAGQFRTPRHIIDFMVEVVDPQKTDSILDPACGTAGFLISSYKHIIKAHDQKDDPENKEIPLTPDERKQLTKNLTGYDISPDMVRLSKVNMYLHGFSNPTIFEYNTLSDESKWDESFDVMLANPPFMSPKGGIMPHKRFSIQANRSEVLFVDYILEHLKPSGRAGIIVPEGIIFQSANAYKALRKKLVEDGLYCVVSLPAGVFNPYAGVKTSILFFDNEISKKVKHILFVKISSDGFDLGAQRRPIIYNDLPLAQEAIHLYQKHVRNNGKLSISGWPEGGGENIDTFPNLFFVGKEEISKSGDYNLSGERYRHGEINDNQKWPMVNLGDVCQLYRGVVYSKKDEVSDNGQKILRANNITLDGKLLLDDIKLISRDLKLKESQKLKSGDIFICLASGSKGHIGKVAFIREDTDYYFGGFMGAIRTNILKIDPRYLFNLLRGNRFNDYLRRIISGANINNLSSDILSGYEIPLPPLEIQNQVVAELDGYQKVIDGAKEIVANWKPDIVTDSKCAKIKLGEVCLRITDGSHFSPETIPDGMPYITVKDIDDDGSVDLANCKRISEMDYKVLVKNGCNPKRGDVLFSKDGTVGKVALIDFDDNFVVLSSLAILTPDESKISSKYLYYALQIPKITNNALGMMKGMAIRRIILRDLNSLEIPLPPIEIQKQIVEKIESERALVDSSKKLIEIYEEKIKSKISEVWGE